LNCILLLVILVFLGTIVITPSAFAAVDMFLKLDGIEGESIDETHADEIDVLAWSFGVSNSGDPRGGGASAGIASFQDLSITKWVDKSSPELMFKTASGEIIPEAILTIREAGLEYLVITLTGVTVSSYPTDGSGGEDRLTENITLKYKKIEMSYREQKDDGSGAAAVKRGWDTVENKEDSSGSISKG